MIKLIVEGNLGADAELKKENGHQFVSMSVADTIRRTDESGNVKETTKWVSATLNGDGGNLLQYLKRGARVHIIGDGDVRMYHSEKQRAFVAGLKVYVREIELVGGSPEAVPRDLYDAEGVAHQISKYYHCRDVANTTLYNRRGEQYLVDVNGWVSATNVQADQPQLDNSETTTEAVTETADETNIETTTEAVTETAVEPDGEAATAKKKNSRQKSHD